MSDDIQIRRLDELRQADRDRLDEIIKRFDLQRVSDANAIKISADMVKTTADILNTLTTALSNKVDAIEKRQYETKGSSTGMRDMYGWIFGGIMLAFTLYKMFVK